MINFDGAGKEVVIDHPLGGHPIASPDGSKITTWDRDGVVLADLKTQRSIISPPSAPTAIITPIAAHIPTAFGAWMATTSSITRPSPAAATSTGLPPNETVFPSASPACPPGPSGEFSMKIQKITPFLVDRFLLVRVYTDQGLVGNGEAGLWAHHGMVHRAILDLSDYYIGKDASRIEHHYQTVSRDAHFMGAALSAALSAIDIALWDLAGQAVGQPVHQLLGGRVRDKIKVFANVNGATLDECAASAQQQVGAGYISLRMSPFLPGFERRTASQVIGDAVAMVAAVRDAVGYNIDLGLEIHRNLRPEEAICSRPRTAALPHSLLRRPARPREPGADGVYRENGSLADGHRRALLQYLPVQRPDRPQDRESHPSRPFPCRRLHPGQKDCRHCRISLCRHLPPPDGQPCQHRRLLPARRRHPQLCSHGEPYHRRRLQ